MIDTTNREKAELVRLMKAFVLSVNLVTNMPNEPEPDVAMESLGKLTEAVGGLRAFVANDEEYWRGDLSMADVGEAFMAALSCACWVLEPKFAKGHHPDCGLWDSHEDTSEEDR